MFGVLLRRLGGRVRYAVLDSPQGGLDAVRDSLRQHIGPLVDGLVSDANRSRCGGYRAAQKFDGLCLEHGALNHSSTRLATMVQGLRSSILDMEKTDYTERFIRAMSISGAMTEDLAQAIGVSYQAIKKVEEGKTKMLKADNNFAAARHMRVDPEWLATGNGEPRGLGMWPCSPEVLAALRGADAETQRRAENAARAALDMELLSKPADKHGKQPPKAA